MKRIKVINVFFMYILPIMLLSVISFVYYNFSLKEIEYKKGKNVLYLVSNIIKYDNYERISNGKYYILYSGKFTSVIDGEGNIIEKPTKNDIYFINTMNSNIISDYYFILDKKFIVKKDGNEVFSIDYKELEFNLKNSSISLKFIDSNNILIRINIDNTYYGYIYNIKNNKLSSKFTSYSNFTYYITPNENVYIKATDEYGLYNIFSINDNQLVLTKSFYKLNDYDNYSLSDTYIYACLENDNKCGIIDYNTNTIVPFKYDNNTIINLNDKYYVLYINSKAYLMTFSGRNILNGYDYIFFTKKYMVALKNNILTVYNNDLTKVKTYNINLNYLLFKDTDNSHKNIELIDEGNTFILNIYDNNNLNLNKKEDISKIKSIIFSESYKDIIDGKRLYPVYDTSNKLNMFYSNYYDEDLIKKIFLYNSHFEAFNLINLKNDYKEAVVLDKCSNGYIGYLLDNKYFIYNPNYDNEGISYGNESKYKNAICSITGVYFKDNTLLYNDRDEIKYNDIKLVTKNKNNKLIIFYDNELGIFSENNLN